jgi:hypothetical protein
MLYNIYKNTVNSAFCLSRRNIMQCPNCSHVFESRACRQCGRDNLEENRFCAWCGSKMAELVPVQTAAQASASTTASSRPRLACSDGMCVGIIGENNRCVICHKPYTGPPAD